MSKSKFNEERHASHRRRRIKQLRADEAAGIKDGDDTIYDGGEIVLSPVTSFHRAAMGTGEIKEHFTE